MLVDKDNLKSSETSILDNFQDSALGILGLFNFHSIQYDYFSVNVKTFFGYDVQEYLNGGLDFLLSTMNETHASLLAAHIFPLYLEHCVKYAENGGDTKKLNFTFEYEVITKSGKPKWCLHQSNVIEVDHNGFPIKDLFLITDINSIKKDSYINFVVSLKGEDGQFETVFSKSFQTKENDILSSREMDILKLLCEGKTTPQIANDLSLSEHTIKSHRKNIMQKMEVGNSIDMVKAAYGRGFL